MQNTRVANLTGLQGGLVIVDTNAHAAPAGEAWNNIYVLEQAVLAEITTNLANADALVAVTLPAGAVIHGRTTSVTLTSGKVIAYQA